MPDPQAHMPEACCDHRTCWVPRLNISRRTFHCMLPKLQGRQQPAVCFSSRTLKTLCLRKFYRCLHHPCQLSALAASLRYLQTSTTAGRLSAPNLAGFASHHTPLIGCTLAKIHLTVCTLHHINTGSCGHLTPVVLCAGSGSARQDSSGRG